MENPQLLAAVLRAPDDDVPRARYAEWCADQADEATRARGRFIAAQLRTARGEAALRDRLESEHLENRYGAAWAGLLAQLVTRFHFDRGFVEHVALDAAAFLERAQILFSEAPVRHLDLSGVAAVAESLFASTHLRTIRSLDLARNGLTDDHAEMLARSQVLDSLRWLSLADNRIGIRGAQALALSRLSEHLVYVALHGNPFEPNERYSYDNGFVVDAYMPDDGVALENTYGELHWLRHRARTIEDAVPGRYRAQGQTSGVR